MVASHDFGATWGTRVKTNSDSLYWFAEGGVVAPNGTVYFSESAENQSATGQVKLAVLRSTNGGSSLDDHLRRHRRAAAALHRAHLPRATSSGRRPTSRVDAAGTLMVAYTLGTASGGAEGPVRAHLDRRRHAGAPASS